MIVQPVGAADLARHWLVVEPLLARALPIAMGRYLPIDIIVMCGSQPGIQAWLIEDREILAVGVTALCVYPRRKACQVFLLSGRRMRDWLDLWTGTVSAYARQLGCDHLEGQGRAGWARVTGATPVATIIVKDL